MFDDMERACKGVKGVGENSQFVSSVWPAIAFFIRRGSNIDSFY